MATTESDERAIEPAVETVGAADSPQAEPELPDIEECKAKSRSQHGRSNMSSRPPSDWAVEPSVGSDAQASDSSQAVEPEIPDVEDSEPEGKPETNDDDNNNSRSPARSASPASSVTSPTSTENNDMANDLATAASEQTNHPTQAISAPPLPSEPIPYTQTSAPLPAEPLPQPEDDGWEYHWNASTNSYWFYNRHTQVWQADNPRLAPSYPTAPGVPQPQPAPIVVGGQPISDPTSLAGGYNPAIHGDYDPNAWYAQAARSADDIQDPTAAAMNAEYASAGLFNRGTGQWQRPDQGPDRHSDEAKSKRQLNNFFDVDAAANEHDGRSLKAERAGKKPSKTELKAYKEKRRARKEEKRRAWLRD
jgi:hypothetical protein